MGRFLVSGAECRSLVLDRNHCASVAEVYIRFALWAAQQSQPLLRESIEQRFSVSRATACRWRNAFESASGSAPARSISPPGGNRSGNSETHNEETLTHD